ncbi:hypothetical protein EDB85DRAFT_1889830 [Lactarius pseudohatsudake]|nr:hypothetical protein EDB85DRAFT_1889830 [Lactarius pseudohatsudake]
MYWRGGCLLFARSPTTSLRLVNDAHPLLHTREGVPEPSPLPFAPLLRSAHPSVSAQLPYPGRALPRPHTLCAYVGGRARRCVRGWAGVACAEGTGVGALALLRHQAYAGAAHKEGGRGGVAQTEGTGGGGDVERWGGVVCPPVPPFRANEGLGRGQRRCTLCAPLPMGREGPGAAYPRAPPFRVNGAARTGERRVGGDGSGTPPFRANGEAPVNAGEGRGVGRRGVGLPSCVPFSTRMGWARGAGGVEGGAGRGAGVLRSLHTQFWVARNRAGMREDEGAWARSPWQKQNVPATSAYVAGTFCFRCRVQNCWTMPPIPPILPTPSALKRGRKRAGRRLSSLHREGRTRVSPSLSLPPRPRRHVRVEGGHTMGGVPLPSPPALLSPVCATPFTRKGGARGYAAPGPSLPIGRGAHKEGTPPHPTSPRRPRPQFPPSGPRHPGLPLYALRLRTPGDAEGPVRPPRSLQRRRRQPSPAHTASPCMPGGAGGTTHPPLRVYARDSAPTPVTAALCPARFTHITPPVHARGRKRGGTRTSPGLRVPPPRGCAGEAGHDLGKGAVRTQKGERIGAGVRKGGVTVPARPRVYAEGGGCR